MRTAIRSKIVQRLRELSWLDVHVRPASTRARRPAVRQRPMVRLGSGLLFDPRTGRIQAL